MLNKPLQMPFTAEEQKLINSTKRFVKETLEDAEGGHDWFHTQRVYNNAMAIAKNEPCDLLTVALAALLHDIADSKFHEGNESIAPKMARAFLLKHNADSQVVEQVIHIIEHVSFKNSFDASEGTALTSELAIVRDADRLDAIGAIGIARCFNYGGFKNRPLFDPDIQPRLNMSKAEYKKAAGPTINHFYEKLLKLKDMMHTRSARRIAEQRHRFMELFLDQFYAEWDGER